MYSSTGSKKFNFSNIIVIKYFFEAILLVLIRFMLWFEMCTVNNQKISKGRGASCAITCIDFNHNLHMRYIQRLRRPTWCICVNLDVYYVASIWPSTKNFFLIFKNFYTTKKIKVVNRPAPGVSKPYFIFDNYDFYFGTYDGLGTRILTSVLSPKKTLKASKCILGPLQKFKLSILSSLDYILHTPSYRHWEYIPKFVLWTIFFFLIVNFSDFRLGILCVTNCYSFV